MLELSAIATGEQGDPYSGVKPCRSECRRSQGGRCARYARFNTTDWEAPLHSLLLHGQRQIGRPAQHSITTDWEGGQGRFHTTNWETPTCPAHYDGLGGP